MGAGAGRWKWLEGESWKLRPASFKLDDGSWKRASVVAAGTAAAIAAVKFVRLAHLPTTCLVDRWWAGGGQAIVDKLGLSGLFTCLPPAYQARGRQVVGRW